MKTKKRNINPETNIYKKKINTRHMNSKSTGNDSCLSSANNSSSGSPHKPCPNTRAKTNSDPYAFSKMDEEDKIPIKRIKVTEKMGKEIGVNTSSLSTMTEPEYLGPCEPGTSIELQGIVWLETATGLLVINVTWRGRTYVGTLMDSTKYEFTPSFSQENLSKFEGRTPSRSSRGKKRQVGNQGNHLSLRSNNVRHSSRLNESINSSNTDVAMKKLSTRQTNNLINYFDSTNQSATASASGDSDTDKNSYSKFSSSSKTRSVTRSITKLNKAALGETNSTPVEDNNNALVKCTKTNCFKRFVDMTAYQYHVQRSHDLSGKINASTDKSEISNNEHDENEKINCIKTELTSRDTETIDSCNGLHTQDNSAFKTTTNCKLNGIITKETNNKIDSFEFNSDSETEKNQYSQSVYNYCDIKEEAKLCENNNSNQSSDIKGFIKNENLSPQFQELSINLPKVMDNVPLNSDLFQPIISSSTREVCSYNNDDKISSSPKELSPSALNKSLSATLKSVSQILSEQSSASMMISQSSTSIRTVTAPTVSIPVELVNTPNNQSSSTVSCPTMIRPKPNQNPITSLIHSSTNRKFKSSKSFSQSNGSLEPFQIPSSSPIIQKKRPLVPLKVAVNQTTNTSVNRMYPVSSQINVTSPNQTSRHIRSSSISPVTPILPATSTTNSSSTAITSTTTTSGPAANISLGNIFHNGQLAVRRPSVSSNITTNPGLSTLVNLKPIQPKPKTSQFPAPLSTGHSGLSSSAYPASQSIIAPSISGLSNIHVSHQRQILPSPISKSDCCANVDESLIHKIESLKTSSLKRKRRKPEKKIRINFHESNRYKKFGLNPIQPKHVTNEHFTGKINTNEDFCLTGDKYKTDEENSHSPGYSDLSETNDTPAPILEKEIDLKTNESDKLVICTDYDISIYRHNSSSSDNYDDPKDLSNKPPALMPAVLSSDLVNGSTNEADYRDAKPRVSRKKTLTNKKTHKLKDITKRKGNMDNPASAEWVNISCSRSTNLTTSNSKSFQSSSAVKKTLSSTTPLSSQSSILSLPVRDYSNSDQNSKFVSANRTSTTSAINEFVRTNKLNEKESERNTSNIKSVESAFQSIHGFHDDSGKVRNKSTTSSSPINNNGKFSVQALTSPQEIASRSFSFATSSTVSSIIPNTKLSNALFKN